MSSNGKLFLIPNTLGSDDFSSIVPLGISNDLKNIKLVFVEHEKAARKALIALGFKDQLDTIELVSIRFDQSREYKDLLVKTLEEGKDVGILSDAGLPAIADPGFELVAEAQRRNFKVKPLVGPSSIFLALMASGFNGQRFAFHGYLAKDQFKRKKEIQHYEREVYKLSQTQIFIETPYRNQHLFNNLLSNCQKNTKICLAVNLTLEDESIEVHTVEQWKKLRPDLNKKQCIFLMYK